MDEPAPPGTWAPGRTPARIRENTLTLYGLSTAVRPVAHESELDDIIDLARSVTGADTAQLNLVGADHQVTLYEATDTPTEWRVPRSASICSTVLDHFGVRDVVVIADTSAAPVLSGHPLVVGPRPTVGSYAGAPLVTLRGRPLGMLCVWSEQPRDLDDVQRRLLRQLARAAVYVLESRRRTPTRRGT